MGNWKNLLDVASCYLYDILRGNLAFALLQLLNDSQRHRHADIRSDQALFKLIPINGFASKSVQ